MSRLFFDPALVLQTHGPLLHVTLGPDGLPTGARAAMAIDASPVEIWSVVSDLDHLPGRIPMIGKVHKQSDDRVSIQLKFRVSIFSASFGFVADVVRDPGKSMELKYVSGEPRNVNLRFDIHPTEQPNRSVLYVQSGFEIQSLGWLVNYFLKGHPEIQFGVFPGSALSLVDAIDRAARDVRNGVKKK